MAKFVKLKKILKIFGLIGLGFFILTTIFCGGTYLFVTANTNLDNTKLQPTHNKIIILDDQGNEINSHSGYNDSTLIPTHTLNAFIAKEDKRFYKHNGIDIIRIFGALKNNIRAKSSVEGGSTITQQLIKNTHLSQEKTISRKLKEIKLAQELEQNYSKDEILDTYLNSIYFGNNLFGIRSASSFYFDKKVENLSIAESAILSGLISAPSVYNPISNLNLSKQKAKMVINLMTEQGYISALEQQSAIQELNNLTISKKTNIGALYLSFATHEALEILGLETMPQNSQIVIKTYLNHNLQSCMENTLKTAVYKAKDLSGITSGIAGAVLDNSTGGIVAFCGDSKYNLLELKRQPASTIKPILVYGPAIENNLISPASFILDEPINIDGYAPQNATKQFKGWTTIRDNIVRSTNIPAIKILNQTGINKSKEFASRLGIQFDQDDDNLALALGGFKYGVTVKDMATSYMALARGGNYIDSTFIKEIIINGNICYKHTPHGTQVMKDSTAYLLTDMLKSVATYGTGRNIQGLNIPIASKTGTNAIDGINHDGWNISYTTEHTAICWTGNLGPVADHSSTQFNGSLYTTYFVKDIFKNLYSTHKPLDFTMPTTTQRIKLDKNLYDNHQLYLADEYSSDYTTEVFATDNLPPKKSRTALENNFVYTPSTSNQDIFFDYRKLIKKYGTW